MKIKMVGASEKALSYKGDSEYALRLVESIREAFDISGGEMPKMLNDFVFNLEVALQDAGVLDDDFNVKG